MSHNSDYLRVTCHSLTVVRVRLWDIRGSSVLLCLQDNENHVVTLLRHCEPPLLTHRSKSQHLDIQIGQVGVVKAVLCSPSLILMG